MAAYAKNPIPLSGDIAKWRALAEYAADWARGSARGVQRLRMLRDDANSACVVGADGVGNACRRLLSAVNRVCDPSDSVGVHSAVLLEVALDVLARCRAEDALRRAGRGA